MPVPLLGSPPTPCALWLFSGSGNLDKQTGKGSTALHYCCLTDNAECLKLLLRGKASIEIGERHCGGHSPGRTKRGIAALLGPQGLSLHALRPLRAPPSAGRTVHCLVMAQQGGYLPWHEAD